MAETGVVAVTAGGAATVTAVTQTDLSPTGTATTGAVTMIVTAVASGLTDFLSERRAVQEMAAVRSGSQGDQVRRYALSYLEALANLACTAKLLPENSRHIEQISVYVAEARRCRDNTLDSALCDVEHTLIRVRDFNEPLSVATGVVQRAIDQCTDRPPALETGDGALPATPVEVTPPTKSGLA